MVGAVIVSADGTILGEGYHQAYGEAHAEVNAVRYALSRRHKLEGTTLYVSLEPCAHHGKTPPCVDLILKHRFARLVFASSDPNPLVSGKGLGKLARTEIIGPELLDPKIVSEAEYLNRAFFKTIKRESWLTAKIALTSDGRMITRTDEPRWITNTAARKDVHLLRASHQVVITGSGTVIADDPQLNVRYSAEELGLGRVVQPRKVVLTRDAESLGNNSGSHRILRYAQDDGKPARIINGTDLRSVITELRQEGLTKFMLEAGPTLTKAFIEAGLVDELVVYQPRHGDIEATIEKLKSQLVDCFGTTRLAMTSGTSIITSPGEEDNIKINLLF